jgi:hypothetical protein
MPDQFPINPGHQNVRRVLRVVGPIVLGVGILFMLAGFVDFALVMAKPFQREPTLFWCFFIGMPLLFVGIVMTHAGFAGKIMRYWSQEIAPPAVDTFNYAAREGRHGVQQIAGAIGEGLRGAVGAAAGASGPPVIHIRCHKCNHDNESGARFCSRCGVSLGKSVPCTGCGELNDPDARFCDNCGQAMESA